VCALMLFHRATVTAMLKTEKQKLKPYSPDPNQVQCMTPTHQLLSPISTFLHKTTAAQEVIMSVHKCAANEPMLEDWLWGRAGTSHTICTMVILLAASQDIPPPAVCRQSRPAPSEHWSLSSLRQAA
jgi:hypothetical protein